MMGIPILWSLVSKGHFLKKSEKVEGAECHCHGVYFEIPNLDCIGQHPLKTNFHSILEMKY